MIPWVLISHKVSTLAGVGIKDQDVEDATIFVLVWHNIARKARNLETSLCYAVLTLPFSTGRPHFSKRVCN